MLEARNLRLALPDRSRKPLFGPAPMTEILRGIDLELAAGESLGVVGESGSGKTSLGRTLLRLYRPTGGSLRFEGRDIATLAEADLRPLRARMQMIFQDPMSSLNPRQRIAEIVTQPLWAFGRDVVADHVPALLERVGLTPALAARYPHELSGGQRQRVGIARAIALQPKLVVADEIVSGLDVSTQAQILSLLANLKRDLGLALVFISHDLSVVRVVCDRVMVLSRGEVMETGPCERLFSAPRHPYTRALLEAVPLPEVDPDWIHGGPIEQEDNRGIGMQIKGTVALVTGTSRGIGPEYVRELAKRGAAKVYAAARDTTQIADLAAEFAGTVEAVELDITDPVQVAAAAERCADVQLLINNAGINHNTGLIAPTSLDNARAEMETNYLGTLAMCRAFAPVLQANGGGAIVNMLSILARVCLPLMGSLSASKAAGLMMTQGVRAELAGQGTTVIAVMPGAVETDMTRDLPPPKMPPADVAVAALDAVEQGEEEVYPGDMATGMAQGLAGDPKAVEKELAGILPQ